jgi:hypothetical protein
LSGNMKTYRRGWIKKHRGCGGLARFVESLGFTHREWCAEFMNLGISRGGEVGVTHHPNVLLASVFGAVTRIYRIV